MLNSILSQTKSFITGRYQQPILSFFNISITKDKYVAAV